MTGQRDADGRDQTNHAATIRYVARKNVRPTMPILPVQEQGTRHQQYTGHQAGHPPTTRRGLCQRRRQTIRRPVHEIPRLQQASRHIPVPQPPTTNLLAHKRTSRKHRQGGEHHERHGQTRPQTANRVNDERRQRYRRKHNDEHPNIGDGRQRPPITRPFAFAASMNTTCTTTDTTKTDRNHKDFNTTPRIPNARCPGRGPCR